MVQLYLLAGAIVTLGFLWFWIVRPIAVSARDAYAEWRVPPAPRRRRRQRRPAPHRRTRPALPIDVMFRSGMGTPRSPVLVSIPVSRYAHTSTGMDAGAPGNPDMDAESTPHGDMSDSALIAFLARLKKADGTYRMSANKIFDAVGGDRNTVLAQVREVRSAPPSPAFRQEDGSITPAHYPVTGRPA